ncbi:hypothetical protein H8R23_13675 [Flavobacterium sp. F-380]|uniref:Uncharacterized protein n=1 Tax=Flavobacterium kayseriense TaxID=2764714 RepID=A0ABR7JAD6_9FLAO|nr:hypothetical protein [Flavobacterium kayseriense]MBC5842461.1 hypothetical protein [Flavobacterium kayseriense]MBC5848991.1 hypothetical protein [Flavobacterium kayseriense]
MSINTNSLDPNGNGQGKYSEKLSQLKKYVSQSKYIEPLEQIKVCNSFGLPYLKNVFRDEYRNRFYTYLFNNVTTCADVTKQTSIPQKYLCECKAYFEKKKLLKVVGFGNCPVTNSRNVQFLSTNPNNWNDAFLLPKSNQSNLF